MNISHQLLFKLNKNPLKAYVMVHNLVTVFDSKDFPIAHINFKLLNVTKLDHTQSKDFVIFENIFVRHLGL